MNKVPHKLSRLFELLLMSFEQLLILFVSLTLVSMTDIHEHILMTTLKEKHVQITFNLLAVTYK